MPSGTSPIAYLPLMSVVAVRRSGTPSTVTVAPGTVEPVGPYTTVPESLPQRVRSSASRTSEKRSAVTRTRVDSLW